MRITLLQTDINWENPLDNLRQLDPKLAVLSGQTDLVVLPEMFSTGFSMQAQALAENTDGMTLSTLRYYAQKYNVAIVGSFIACNNNRTHCYNRAFLLTPEGNSYYADKKHLFRMGQEVVHFNAGTERMIVKYRDWKILLLVCYDLRFPVWSRNIGCEYDLLIYVANWPSTRRRAWDLLLPARAIENQCYVCGVNRIGTDGNLLNYNGGSILYSPRGEILTQVEDNQEGTATVEISLTDLQHFREKFPVWKDADDFRFL